ncbi:hypothetical protein EV363DRAFT_1253640 [Boletus edulis]|uniref:Uncharacterized protein n=1 Tax=Boletus edulis BED1 TaxID=1328754 RepID=A0AAD4BT36_BOLED|nr:hypothetical protein EV363DRAFT_1253640 [Boletus edulis]KAF8417266.1 hypothetical protein L210DRAFT_3581142 [Boletus edulis BED1]KAF8438921.1 hypothetical protein L210DRAFT_3542645 [Boletus edulis BED1]
MASRSQTLSIRRLHQGQGIVLSPSCLWLHSCSSSPAASPLAPKLNPWSSLAISEVVQIQDWLFTLEQSLNLTQIEVAAPSDNQEVAFESAEAMREASELYHRIKFRL